MSKEEKSNSPIRQNIQIGQYQKQVSLLSGISLEVIKDALIDTGVETKYNEKDIFGLSLSCKLDELSFSISLISDYGNTIENEEELGMVIQCFALFSIDDFESKFDILSILNEWNTDETFAKAYLVEEIMIVEMIIPASGVVAENVNDGLKAWIDICSDFSNFIAEKSENKKE